MNLKGTDNPRKDNDMNSLDYIVKYGMDIPNKDFQPGSTILSALVNENFSEVESKVNELITQFNKAIDVVSSNDESVRNVTTELNELKTSTSNNFQEVNSKINSALDILGKMPTAETLTTVVGDVNTLKTSLKNLSDAFANHNHDAKYEAKGYGYSKEEVDDKFKHLDIDTTGLATKAEVEKKFDGARLNNFDLQFLCGDKVLDMVDLSSLSGSLPPTKAVKNVAYKRVVKDTEWLTDEGKDLKYIDITHSLGTDNVLPHGYELATRESIIVPSKGIDNNTIRVYTDEPVTSVILILNCDSDVELLANYATIEYVEKRLEGFVPGEGGGSGGNVDLANYYTKTQIDKLIEPIGEEYIRSLFSKEGDPSDPVPIAYYTKEESDAKYSTKVELEAVRQETFQSGSSTKQNLADKLTSVGVPNMSVSNTFAELIANIPSGGKRYATGSSIANRTSVNFTYEDGTSTKMYYIDIPINEIPFVPSLLMTRATYGTIEYVTTYINQPYLISNVLQTTYGKNTSTSASLRYRLDENVNKIDAYRIPIGGNDMEHKWIAYE